MNEAKILHTYTGILFVARHKLSGDYVDEDGNITKHIEDAAGFQDYQNALNWIKDFDDPDEWYLVTKITNIVAVGKPIEVIKYI